jgi:Rieske Fe-S protein
MTRRHRPERAGDAQWRVREAVGMRLRRGCVDPTTCAAVTSWSGATRNPAPEKIPSHASTRICATPVSVAAIASAQDPYPTRPVSVGLLNWAGVVDSPWGVPMFTVQPVNRPTRRSTQDGPSANERNDRQTISASCHHRLCQSLANHRRSAWRRPSSSALRYFTFPCADGRSIGPGSAREPIASDACESRFLTRVTNRSSARRDVRTRQRSSPPRSPP